MGLFGVKHVEVHNEFVKAIFLLMQDIFWQKSSNQPEIATFWKGQYNKTTGLTVWKHDHCHNLNMLLAVFQTEKKLLHKS